jgi:hypothetical protein
MLSVVIKSVLTIVIMLSVVILNVVALLNGSDVDDRRDL